MRRTPVLAAVLATAGLLLAACGGSAAGDKSGGPGPATVLVLANNDGNLSGAPAVAHFAAQVAKASGGKLTVRVESGWQGGGNEGRVIRDVAAGKADLGWSGTRAFDTVGVTTFQPLHAPFLVGSYAAEAAVVKDPVAARMLGGLSGLGLTGLGLVADELRMPAGADKPLLTPADFKGMRFGTVASTVQTNGLRALGATPATMTVFRSPDIDDLGGAETMWWTYQNNNQYGHLPYVTPNVVLWPRTGAVFANTARLNQLGASAKGWLTQAAADATAWSATHAGDNVAAELTSVCISGARVATATPAQLADLRAAAQPAYDGIRADAANAAALDTITALAGSAPADAALAVPAGCVYHPGEAKSGAAQPVRTLTGPGRPGKLPPGTYRYGQTRDDLLAHGSSPHDADINAGLYTWTLHAGRWQYQLKPAVPGVSTSTSCEGWYDVDGTTATFATTSTQANGECAPPVWSARWSLDGATLTWTGDNLGDFDYVWAGQSWTRIG